VLINVCSAFVGLGNKLYNIDGTYIKIKYFDVVSGIKMLYFPFISEEYRERNLFESGIWILEDVS
jgi:hypothetical protein